MTCLSASNPILSQRRGIAMPLKQITAPATQTVSVAEVKDFLRIQGTTAEDFLLHGFIKVADKYAENYTKRALLRQQFELRIDDFPGSSVAIELPRPPISTASTDIVITYVEDTTAGNTTTVPSTLYDIDMYSEPAAIYPTYENEWPDAVRDERNAVRITYYSGYANQAAVPQEIKQWVMLRVGSMYENRESLVNTGTGFREMKRSYVDGLLDEYVIAEHN